MGLSDISQEDVDEFIQDSIPTRSKREVEDFVKHMYAKQEGVSQFKKISDIQNFIVSELLTELEQSEKKLAIVESKKDFQDTFNYTYWDNQFRLKHSASFDLAEVHSLRMAYKGISMLLKTASAYQLDNALNIYETYKDKSNVVMKTIVHASKMYPTLLTLRSNGRAFLQSLLNDSSDIIEGLRIIAGILRSDTVRESFLLHPINQKKYDDFISDLDHVSTFLAGPVAVKIGQKSEHEKVYVNVNATALFANPLNDLRSLFPTEYTKNGHRGVVFPDLTFGGVTPQMDLVSTYCELKKKMQRISDGSIAEIEIGDQYVSVDSQNFLDFIGCPE
ncbi:MAG: hypothetical protein HYS98_02220 [Deltaproteobacteria bacterium]|nr:hypothetical protein [Deltaproteobacteria bacterium]